MHRAASQTVRKSLYLAHQFGQAPFQCAGCEQPDASVPVELDNKIDVASGFSIAPQCNPGTCAICAPIS